MRLFVRPPSDAFRRALSQHPGRDGIDPERALRQHASFVAALEATGLAVEALAPEPELPDAPFVSDLLIALARPGAADGGTVLLVVARPAIPSRRPEVPSLAAAVRACLPPDVAEVVIEPPATLEGGDVVVYGRRIAIGVSARTNKAGARSLAVAAAGLGYRPFLCPVTDRLHLATAVSPIRDDLLIGTPAGFASLDAAGPDAAPAAEVRRLVLPPAEAAGANVLAIGRRSILAAGNPLAAGLLRGEGCSVAEVALDEFGLADGGPTCLVNIVP